MGIESEWPVTVTYDVMIPTRDGTRIAANLFLPDHGNQVPAILSFYPYIKDVGLGRRFAPIHRHFASRGYAVLHADFRGTGCSEGVNPHPFDVVEREDGYDIVEWAAGQDWCSGAVGIWGISYGGITSLSIAATRPPHLAAIIPVDATFDNLEWLFRTHGAGGLLLGDVDWGTRMAAMNLLPPLSEDAAGAFADGWRSRLEENRPWFLDWHGKPPSEDFWLRRRIPIGDIDVPTFAITGWHDAYTAPMTEVFAAVRAPKRLLVGPWKHTLPDMSPVEPINGVYEMDRWWDRWLKGVDNGVDGEPPVTLYVMGANKWRSESEWPLARASEQRLYFHAGGRLEHEPSGEGDDQYEYDARVGVGSIGHNGHRVHLPIPEDQSADDHMSLCYTSDELSESIEITGTPRLRVVIAATSDEANIVAKLCVVDSEGRSRRISQGNGNPARENAHAPRRPLVAGERRHVIVEMHPTSVVVPAGARLRVAVSGSDFPELWPTPEPYDLTVHRGGEQGSGIDLPVALAREVPLPAPAFRRPMANIHDVEDDTVTTDVVHCDLGGRAVAFETRGKSVENVRGGAVLVSDHHATVATDADRPWATAVRADSRFEVRQRIGTIVIRVQTLLTAFTASATADVRVDGVSVFQRDWRKSLRDRDCDGVVEHQLRSVREEAEPGGRAEDSSHEGDWSLGGGERE